MEHFAIFFGQNGIGLLKCSDVTWFLPVQLTKNATHMKGYPGPEHWSKAPNM
jgi:hypothetical protein